MKLAASQIAWQPEEEALALSVMKAAGFSALEMAPTRVAGSTPYNCPEKAAEFAQELRAEYGFGICSMQSIWYGVAGNLFGEEQAMLTEYTKKAMLFAQAAGCGNLVFGCPRGRLLPGGVRAKDTLPLMRELGDYAATHGTCFSLEPLPEAYGTNYANTTAQALELAELAGSPGFKVNLDFATMLANGEDAGLLRGKTHLLGHVHISDEGLGPVRERPGHKALAEVLRSEGYGRYVSIEMKAQAPEVFEQVAAYVAEVFL